MARQATDEWHAYVCFDLGVLRSRLTYHCHALRLEIPARLKIAIQQVLDEPQQSVPTYQDFTSYPADPAQTEYETQWTEEETAAYNAYYYGSEYAEQSATYQHGDATEADASSELSDAPVVEAHEVIAEEALIYEEPMQPVTSWSCRQCTFLNPMSESFCKMCMDHISLSIPCEGMEQPVACNSAEASNEVHACDAAVEQEVVHSAVMVSIIPCPRYAPSAPDFDQDGDDNTAISTATASFQELQLDTRHKDQPPAPPMNSADFLSLAFQSKIPMNAMKPQETRPTAGATTIEFV